MWPRALFNSLVFPLWTALSVTVGLIAGWLTRDPFLFYRWQPGWARWLFRFCGIEVEVRGAEHMSPDGAYVIVANHASYMDVPALFATLPKSPQFMAKAELARIPFLGAALRAGRHILVSRGTHGTARSSLDAAAAQLKSGAAILMFPEGTRATSDAIGRLKTGAFRLAKLGEIPILVVGISGTRYVLPKHGRLIKPHRISVNIAPPLTAAMVRDTPLNELSERTRALLGELSGLPLANSSRVENDEPAAPAAAAGT